MVTDRKISVAGDKGEKRKFDDFYLPNTTSYLCMDYLNADGQSRSVMVYMAGGQIAYRLIQAHFDASWVREGGRYTEASGLSRRLLEAGVAFHPVQITTAREYRSIIQGVPDGRQSADYRTLRANYSLAGSKHALPKIDKIILGMIRKMVDLRSLQSIILACIQNDDEVMGGDPHALMGQLQNIDELVQQGEALEQTEAALPHYQTAEEAHKEWSQANASLSRLKSTIVLSLPKMEAEQSKLNASIKDKREQLDQLREQYSSRIGQLSGEIEVVVKQFRDVQKRQNQLEAKNLEWQAKDPSSMEQRAANEGLIRQKLDGVKARLDSLEGKTADIQAEFEKLKTGIRISCNEAIEAASRKADQELDIQQSARNEAQSNQEVALQALRDKLQILSEELNNKASESKSRLAVLKAFKPVPDQSMQDARALIDGTIELDRKAVEQAREELDSALKNYNHIKDLSDQELRRKESKKNQIDRLNVDISKIRSSIHASNASLLGFLRSEVPNWESSIGKIIRDDLLQREDLSPRYESGGQESLYGLKVDLGPLMPPQDEDSLRELLRARELTMKDLRQDMSGIDKNLDDLGKQMSDAGKAKSTSDLRLSTAQNQLKRRGDERRSLVQAQESELTKLRERNASEILAAEKAAQQCAHDLFNFKHETRVQLEEEREVHSKGIKVIDDRISTIKQRLREDKRQAEQIRDNEISQCESNLSAKLSDEGLDSSIITGLNRDKDRLGGELKTINNEAEALRLWRDFQARYPVEHTANVQEVDRLKDQERTLKERKKNAEEAGEREAKDLRSLLGDEASRDAKLTNGINDLKRMLMRDLEEVGSDPEGAHAILDPEFILASVKAENDKMRQAKVELEKAFSQIRRAFLSRRESDVARSWLAEELEQSGTDYLAMEEYLTSWYRYRQEGAHRNYLDRLSALKLSIDNFASSRDHFHASVVRFGSRLKKALAGIRISDAIENLTLEITSDSRDDSFMPKALSRLREMTINSEVLENDPHARDLFVRDVRILRNKLQDSNTLNMKPEQMINITGQVTENGNVRRFDRTTKLDQISSSGLSLMIQSTILMAFIDQVRGSAPVDFPWGVDELGTIDDSNIVLLVEALNRHHIHLITAQPSVTASAAVFKCFKWALKPTPKGNIQATPVVS